MYIGMYINNIHIMFYLLFGIFGLCVGQLVAWMNVRMPDNEKVCTKIFFKNIFKGIKSGYIMMLITAVMYIALLYRYGIQDTFVKNLELIKFLILTPMLISAFFIDLKHRIIPNRLNLTIFEVGLIVVFLYGINNVNVAKDMILGMITGGGIFLIITIIRRINSRKRGNGTWRCKTNGSSWNLLWSIFNCSININCIFHRCWN